MEIKNISIEDQMRRIEAAIQYRYELSSTYLKDMNTDHLHNQDKSMPGVKKPNDLIQLNESTHSVKVPTKESHDSRLLLTGYVVLVRRNASN